MLSSSKAVRATTIVGPRHRMGPRVPLRPLAGLAVWAVGFAIVPLLPAGTAAEIIAQGLSVVGVVSACWAATWVEASLFYAGRARHKQAGAALVALAIPPLIVALTAAVDGLLAGRGYPADVLLLGVIAGIWLLCSFAGSVLIMLLDAGISALLGSFRNRVRALVLVLLGFGCLFAVWGAPRLFSILQAAAASSAWSSSSVIGDLALRLGTVPVVVEAAATSSPGVLFVAAAVILVLLPAVLSATAKFAGLVMERIYPLIHAFGDLADGQRSIQVEEGGSTEFVALASHFNRMVAQLGKAERMERAFGRYVNTQVFRRIEQQVGEAELPTSIREASVFFADIRGFTSLSEHLPAEAVVELLNLFFARAVDVVNAHEGYLNKFLGDALMVVFNGPFDQADHCARATQCAIALLDEIAEMNTKKAFPHVGTLSVGVGVASGPMVCGNVGSSTQMEYTVIGDVVNTAARLAGEAHGGEVWMTRSTAEALPADIPTRPLPPLALKGKGEPVEVAAWPAAPVAATAVNPLARRSS